MASLEPKKLALIRVLQILRKYSDYNHPMLQEDIAEKLGIIEIQPNQIDLSKNLFK